MIQLKIVCRQEKDLNGVIRPVVIFNENKGIFLDCLSYEGHSEMSYSYYLRKTKPATFEFCQSLLEGAGYNLQELEIRKRLN